MKKVIALLPLVALVWACTPPAPPAETSAPAQPASQSTAPTEVTTESAAAEQIDITESVGKVVPFELRSVSGDITTSEELKDKVVLLDFWASWCVSCKAATPRFQTWHDQYAEKGLAVYAVNAMEQLDEKADKAAKIAQSGEAVTKYQKEHKYTLNFAVYGDELIERWKIGGVPFLVLFNQSGEVAMVRTDASEESLKALEEKITELLQS